MHVNFFNEDNTSMPHITTHNHRVGQKPRKRYGFFKFMFDILMTVLTGGFWIIWIFVREMRKR